MSTIEHIVPKSEPEISKKPSEELPRLVIDDDIREEARRRIQTAEVEAAAARALAIENEKNKADELKVLAAEEKIRARVEQEKIRLLAEKEVAEAEAKKKAVAREVAIAAEMERLKRRTKVEILEDTVAELRAEIAELKRCTQVKVLEEAVAELRAEIAELKRGNGLQDVWEQIDKIITYQKEYAMYMSDHTYRMTTTHHGVHSRPSVPCPAPLLLSKKTA
jgi:hypothetical protein